MTNKYLVINFSFFTTNSFIYFFTFTFEEPLLSYWDNSHCSTFVIKISKNVQPKSVIWEPLNWWKQICGALCTIKRFLKKKILLLSFLTLAFWRKKNDFINPRRVHLLSRTIWGECPWGRRSKQLPLSFPLLKISILLLLLSHNVALLEKKG